MANPLHMPRGSWPQLKRIIRAYGEVQDAENPTVEDVARIAGLHRPVVSGNNECLRDLSILVRDGNKLTETGIRLARSLALENEGLIAEALQEVIRANPTTLGQWVSMIRARGAIKTDFLRGTIALAAGATDNKQVGPVNAVLELLQEAKAIQIDGDTIRTATLFRDLMEGVSPLVEPTPAPANVSPTNQPPSGVSRIPLPLGPTRLAFIELPKDWQPKELSKLIKILQIALGDDSEQAA